jgi:hypothetical protein
VKRASAAILLTAALSCASDEPGVGSESAQHDAAKAADSGTDSAIVPGVSDAATPPNADGAATADAAIADDPAATADAGGLGTPCTRNAECEGSPEAAHAAGLRCPSELVCLEGHCRASCSTQCLALRDDVNPCESGGYCDGALMLCRLRPARCEVVGTCPKYRPKLADGGVGTWSCESGRCVYPGYTFPTQD